MSAPEEEYQGGAEGAEGATTADTVQDDYIPSQSAKDGGDIPVQSDTADVEDPIDAKQADSDEQLARDDNEAIDKSNIIDERTRGAKPEGRYQEPGDEEGLPQ